ncbi:hypothetical protein O5O45_07745 [Hahella aquimaris]|uniref:hypothetical protein n=1 Tax=Hahella sp. HNIBRBA332 TaxID=3015983 RepID=UPI00273A7E59|nr:hypothetical protein [Hahella sp. HNIBRBA332]WLQ15804.1 hypothetical protein O5O45_07745 [Hahella sp. HNIBRBA332]
MFDKVKRQAGMSFMLLAGLSAGAADVYADSDFYGERHRPHRYFEAEFGFTTDQTCVRSLPQAPGTVSIDPDTRQLLVDAQIVDMSGYGVMTFSRDGTMTLEQAAAGELNKSNLASGDFPIQTGFSPYCEGTYELKKDNQIAVAFNCVIDVPAQSATIHAGPVYADGYLTRGGRGMTLNLQQNIQTLTVDLPGTSIEFQRMCLQRFALEKIK